MYTKFVLVIYKCQTLKLVKNYTPVLNFFDHIICSWKMSVSEITMKKLLAEGKTKQIWEVSNDEVMVVSKDRITAGDGLKAHDMVNKSVISTQTTSNIFEMLNEAGIKTAFIRRHNDKSFLAKNCAMVPIEWVTRRLATGSFLKRNVGVEEGTGFYPPKSETFFKDDANHDPQWTDEQILAAKFIFNGLEIGQTEVDIMKKTSVAVFEILEKYWASQNCVLVDMKIEFGVSPSGEILLADVIDSDSWRLWPSGDKRLMKDKQVYRNLKEVKEADLLIIRENFQWIADKTEMLKNLPIDALVVIMMGSSSDLSFCKKIVQCCEELRLPCVLRVSSAHKSTDEVLRIVAEYDGSGRKVVYVAVAGRSNGLGLVIAGNSMSPVINCPPSSENTTRNIWSSLSLPSGIGCGTVIYPEAAALSAAHILSLNNCRLWATLRVKLLNNYITLKVADKAVVKG